MQKGQSMIFCHFNQSQIVNEIWINLKLNFPHTFHARMQVNEDDQSNLEIVIDY